MIPLSSTISRRCTLALVLVLLMPVLSSPAHAETYERLAVIQILDDSGSMRSNDPSDLRYTAAQLFVSLLDEGDAAGALRFSTTSSPITNGIEIISSSEQQARMVDTLAAVPADGFTDVKAAFDEARRMQAAFNGSGYQVVVIFLTDGSPEIPAPYPAYEAEALEAAKSLGVPILSVALTNAGQSPFLNQLASQTGGRVIFAKSAADLLDIYLQLLGELKDRTVIGSGSLEAPAQAALSLDPALVPYVDQVSFVAGHTSSSRASLIAPDGQVITEGSPEAALAIRDHGFSVISIPQPTGGDWLFELSGSGKFQARAILYSRLRARLVEPEHSFEAGQPLRLVVKLVEEQPGHAPVTIIGEASFAAWITRPDGTQESLDRFFDDGTHGDELAGDGLYTRLYVNTGQEGIYNIEIRGSKGAIPVSSQAQLQAIAFPLPVLDQPALQHYDIRTEAVPLQFHLSGSLVNVLDRGSFTAAVTTPSGDIERIPLAASGNTYSAEYLPEEDGLFEVRFDPVDAAYLGLPYEHGLATSFTARLVSTLSVQRMQVGLQPTAKGELPGFEAIQSHQGIPVLVTISSTSPDPQYLRSRVENLPGFSLLETGALAVAAGGNTTLTLHILSEPGLTAQAFQGHLVFSAPDGVDLVGGNLPLAFEIYEPQLNIAPLITSTVSPDSCLHWAPVQVALQINSTSKQAEQVGVLMEGLPASLDQETVTVEPGKSEVILAILPKEGVSFSPGGYTGRLVIDTLRPGLSLTNGSSFPVAFQVDPVWVTCQKPMIISGSGLLIGVILFASVMANAREKNRPPIVTGTLILWKEDTPDLTTPVNLTEFDKIAIRIGSGSQNEITMIGEGLEDEHAVITAERGEGGEPRFTLQPIGQIRQGYSEISAPAPIEENAAYKIGNQFFKFIRDI